MRTIIVAITLLFAANAQAQQTQFEIARGEDVWTFDVAWLNAKKKAHKAQFSLDSAAIKADVETPMMFQEDEANAAILAAVKDFARSLKGVELKVKLDKAGNLQLSGTGPAKRLKAAAKEVKQVQQDALKAYMREHGFTKLKGKIMPVHAKHAYRYADAVRPLAEALGAGELKQRAFAARALAFVQNIPYEEGQKGGDDKGFRLPLSVLATNMGDCDSKATLYLAILKAAHPSLDTTMVYIPGHAFVGLGLKPRDGDVTFQARGKTWVMAEPVGPALAPLGDGDKRSKARAKKGKLKTRQVKDN